MGQKQKSNKNNNRQNSEVQKDLYLDEFQLIKTIAKPGEKSIVYLARSKKDNKKYALKVLNSGVTRKKIKNEYNIQQAFKHPNIIKSYKAQKVKKFTKRDGKVINNLNYIQLEYAQCGDFYKYIKKGEPLSDRICNFYFRQLVAAVEQIHNQGYCHRDLKLQNILLDEKFNLKIADFGFADSTKKQLNQYCGTKAYMAPEIQKDQYYDGNKVDIFTLGVILFLLKDGEQPFYRAIEKDFTYQWIYQKNYEMFWKTITKCDGDEWQWYEKYSPAFRKIIFSMLAFNPEKRLTIEQIKQTDFYEGEIATQEEVIQEMSKRLKEFDPKCEEERLKYIAEQKRKKAEKQIELQLNQQINPFKQLNQLKKDSKLGGMNARQK